MLARDKETRKELTAAYREAYKHIKTQADSLLNKITRAQAEGVHVNKSWLLREEAYRSLLIQVQRRINTFADIAESGITKAQSDLAEMGAADALDLLSSIYPPELGVSFAQLPTGAIDNLIGVLSDGSPLADLLGELGPQAEELIKRTLINGIAAGTPIRQMARSIQSALNHSRARAMNITRTESLRAYREASRESYKANEDVVKGWVWLCSFTVRTCAACFAMHGTVHSNDEQMDCHVQCRCVMSPITKSYRELGIRVDEPERDYGDAETWVRAQPEQVQIQILGSRDAYQMFKNGEVSLRDFVGEKNDPRWGRSRYTKPLREIQQSRRRRAA